MRPLVLAFALTLSSSLAAQTQFADSAGVFVGVDQISFGSGAPFSIDATAGYRYESGVDVGLRAATSRIRGYGSGSSLRLAPSIGYTRPLSRGALARVQATAEYTSLDQTLRLPDGPNTIETMSYSKRTVGADLSASVSRPIRVLGSVQVQPTVGGYVTAIQAFDINATGSDRYLGGIQQLRNEPGALGAGIEVALPISFRLFGADAAFVPSTRIQLAGDAFRIQRYVGAESLSRLSLRLNF